MNKYLSTEELLELLKLEESSVKIVNREEYVSIPKIKSKYRFIYWIFLGIALLHLTYISILFLSPQKGINIFGEASYMAVSFNQQIIDNKVVATVSIIEQVSLEDLEVGDLVAFYGRFGNRILVIEQVAIINIEDEIIITSADGVIQSSIKEFDDIIGLYKSQANLLQTAVYASLELRGYLITIGSYVLMFGVIYILYIKKPKDKPIVTD